MRARSWLLLGSGLVFGVSGWACSLNPQPLPPGEDEEPPFAVTDPGERGNGSSGGSASPEDQPGVTSDAGRGPPQDSGAGGADGGLAPGDAATDGDAGPDAADADAGGDAS